MFETPEWAARVQECANARPKRMVVLTTPGRGATIQKVMTKYWESDGTVIAVLFRYQRTDGERFVVKMLRVGNVCYQSPIGVSSQA